MIFLMQNYGGGTIQRYRGKYRSKAQERIEFYKNAGWGSEDFAIIPASSLNEAHEKAQKIFIKRGVVPGYGESS